MSTRRQFIQLASAAGILLGTSPRFAGAAETLSREAQQALTPAAALQKLKDGNKRFVSGTMRKRDLMAQVKASASGQFPFACVIGCIDSRVGPELVFDQGIGDIFSPRIAGNFVNTDIIGSTEFTTKLAGARLVVVLGHSACGAVAGATDNAHLGNLTRTLSNIMPAVESVTDVQGERNSTNAAFVQKVAEANVRLNVAALSNRSKILRELKQHGQLDIVGAMYNIANGQVTFFT